MPKVGARFYARETKHRSAREDVRQLNKASYEGSGEQKNDLWVEGNGRRLIRSVLQRSLLSFKGCHAVFVRGIYSWDSSQVLVSKRN